MWSCGTKARQCCFSVFSFLKVCFISHFLPRVFLHYLWNLNFIPPPLYNTQHHYHIISDHPCCHFEIKCIFSLIQSSNFIPNLILNSYHNQQFSDPAYENMAYIVYCLYCHRVNLDIVLDDTDGCSEQYRCGSALFLLWKFAKENGIVYDRAVDCAGHGKKNIDGQGGWLKNIFNNLVMHLAITVTTDSCVISQKAERWRFVWFIL